MKIEINVPADAYINSQFIYDEVNRWQFRVESFAISSGDDDKMTITIEVSSSIVTWEEQPDKLRKRIKDLTYAIQREIKRSQPPTQKPASAIYPSSFAVALLESDDRLGRFIAIVVFLLFASFLAVPWLAGVLRVDSVEVTMEGNGAQSFRVFGKTVAWSTLVPASKPTWTDTGCVIPAGESVIVTVTGRTHNSINHLVNSANDDEQPELRWSGPFGVKSRRGKDEMRLSLLMCSNVGHGSIIGTLAPEDDSPTIQSGERPSAELRAGILYPDTSSIDLNSDQPVLRMRVTNTEEKSMRLWLMVNDAMLYKSAKQAYMADCSDACIRRDEAKKKNERGCKEWDRREIQGTDNQPYMVDARLTGKAAQSKRTGTWEALVAEEYWTMWWDDNVGDFLVHIERDSGWIRRAMLDAKSAKRGCDIVPDFNPEQFCK